MNSIQSFLAPACAQSASVKSSSATQASGVAEDASFADVLVLSTENTTVRPDMPSASDLPLAVHGQTSEKDENIDPLQTDVTAVTDLVALIAQISAEGQPVTVVALNRLAAESPGIAPGTMSSSDSVSGPAPFVAGLGSTAEEITSRRPAIAPTNISQTPLDPDASVPVAGAVSLVAIARAATRAPAVAEPVTTSAGPNPAPEETPAPFVTISNIVVASADSDGARVADHAGREGENDHRITSSGGSPVAAQIKAMEFRTGGTVQTTDELRQPGALPSETAQGATLMAGVPAHTSGAHNLMPAGQASISLVPTHIESPAWSKDFGQHVIRLAVDGQPSAEIHLNPPDLGPIRVSIEIKGQEAMLHFVAEHPQTREALESALPRLREMFAAGSLTLADANVTGEALTSQGGSGQEQRFLQSSSPARSERLMVVEDALPAEIAVPRSPARRTGIDLFA